MSPEVVSALTLASLLLFSSENLGEVPPPGSWGVVCDFSFAICSYSGSPESPSRFLFVEANVTFGI